MTISLAIELAWKSAVIAGFALVLLPLVRRRSAAERSAIAHLGLLSVMALPIAIAILPELRLAASPRFVAALNPTATSVLVDRPNLAVGERAIRTLRDEDLIGIVYTLPLTILVGLLLIAMFRLVLLRQRSQFIVDPRWHAALAAAQRRLGFKHGAVLLESSEVAAPVSWGFVRPTILLGAAATSDTRHAEAVIAHELAHVARFDWLKLILGRTAVAVFWFNPLVWLLAQRCHDLCEEAADDAVLRADVKHTEYAELLVETAHRTNGVMVLATHGVAPTKSELGRRVMNVLDRGRRRAPAGLGWATGCLVAALAINVPLAALEPVAARLAMTFGDAGTGERAAAELAAIGSPHTLAIADAIRRQDWEARNVEGFTRFKSAEAVAPLQAALYDPRPVVRRIALWGLSEIRDSRSVDEVAQMLSDPAPEVRAEAARALGDLGATDHSIAIAALLGDDRPDVRVQAAHALGDLRDPATRTALENATRDASPSVRSKASWALAQVTEAESVLKNFSTR